MTPKIYPISELQNEHRGYVVLINIAEFCLCRGMMGRPWWAHECGGENSAANMRPFFSHFMKLSEIREAEEAEIIMRYGGPLTASEIEFIDLDYKKVADPNYDDRQRLPHSNRESQ